MGRFVSILHVVYPQDVQVFNIQNFVATRFRHDLHFSLPGVVGDSIFEASLQAGFELQAHSLLRLGCVAWDEPHCPNGLDLNSCRAMRSIGLRHNHNSYPYIWLDSDFTSDSDMLPNTEPPSLSSSRSSSPILSPMPVTPPFNSLPAPFSIATLCTTLKSLQLKEEEEVEELLTKDVDSMSIASDDSIVFVI
jgi:hypothetical protein